MVAAGVTRLGLKLWSAPAWTTTVSFPWSIEMHFIARDEADFLEKKLRRQIDEQARPKIVLYYQSGKRDYCDSANAIAASIGAFTEASLHFTFCVTGDGWNEGEATNERWSRYRKWRAANGENRRLHDAPWHQFEPHETGQLSKAIEFALLLGWDALVSARPGRQLLALSHDDRIEIYRGFNGRLLAEKLMTLGYWHR